MTNKEQFALNIMKSCMDLISDKIDYDVFLKWFHADVEEYERELIRAHNERVARKNVIYTDCDIDNFDD